MEDTKKKLIWPSEGLLHQLKNVTTYDLSLDSFYTKIKKTTVIMDVGDYSMVINKNLKGAKGVKIRTRKSEWYEAKNILSTESGTILEFKENIGKTFKKGCIYPIMVWVLRKDRWSNYWYEWHVEQKLKAQWKQQIQQYLCHMK